MIVTNIDLSRLDQAERADLPRATYFMLESYFGHGGNDCLTTIEEAEGMGSFAIHIGLPDRPAHRYAITFNAFENAMLALEALKQSHPSAGMWLSCQELLAEIKGADVWRGVVTARAGFDPTDRECLWQALAEHIARCDAEGSWISLSVHVPSVFDVIADHINLGRRNGEVV